jgi:hypothetical protein
LFLEPGKLMPAPVYDGSKGLANGVKGGEGEFLTEAAVRDAQNALGERGTRTEIVGL